MEIMGWIFLIVGSFMLGRKIGYLPPNDRLEAILWMVLALVGSTLLR